MNGLKRISMSPWLTRLLATGMLICTHAAFTLAQSDSVVAQAASLRQAHAPQQAEELLTSYLDTHAEDPDVLTALAALRIEQSRPDDAVNLLATALRIRPDSIPANQALGDLLLSTHHYPEAMDRFETILNVSPMNPIARAGEHTAAIQLALDTRRAGREDAALACLEHAAQRLPDDPVLLTDLGIEADRLHQLPKAAVALEQALHLAPNDPTALYALARVEIDQQHLPSAEAHLRTYLKSKPTDASAHFGLGRLLLMELRTDEATTELRRSIALEPNQTESYYQLGQIELDAHHDAAAQPLFAKVIDHDPKHGGALTGLGILAYRAKNFTTAEHNFALAIESSPDYQPAHYYYGLTLAKLGKTSAAQAELKRAADLASNLHAAPVQQIQVP